MRDSLTFSLVLAGDGALLSGEGEAGREAALAGYAAAQKPPLEAVLTPVAADAPDETLLPPVGHHPREPLRAHRAQVGDGVSRAHCTGRALQLQHRAPRCGIDTLVRASLGFVQSSAAAGCTVQKTAAVPAYVLT